MKRSSKGKRPHHRPNLQQISFTKISLVLPGEGRCLTWSLSHRLLPTRQFQNNLRSEPSRTKATSTHVHQPATLQRLTKPSASAPSPHQRQSLGRRYVVCGQKSIQLVLFVVILFIFKFNLVRCIFKLNNYVLFVICYFLLYLNLIQAHAPIIYIYMLLELI